MLNSKANQKSNIYDRIVDDQKKDNIAQWLRRDLSLFEIEKPNEDDPKYRPSEGFIIYWDYILNLVKEYKQI